MTNYKPRKLLLLLLYFLSIFFVLFFNLQFIDFIYLKIIRDFLYLFFCLERFLFFIYQRYKVTSRMTHICIFFFWWPWFNVFFLYAMMGTEGAALLSSPIDEVYIDRLHILEGRILGSILCAYVRCASLEKNEFLNF